MGVRVGEAVTDPKGIVTLVVAERLVRTTQGSVGIRLFHGDAEVRWASGRPAWLVHHVHGPEGRVGRCDRSVYVPDQHTGAEARRRALRPRASERQLLAVL